MLKEHLSQEHDKASRRYGRIDRHVQWIHRELLSCAPGKILDLGCGPGVYSSRLAVLGHQCLGVDFSPASIAYAREQAGDLACAYLQEDVRSADFGIGFDLAMVLSGEFNTFSVKDASGILEKAHDSLVPGGTLLLEAHTFDGVRCIGEAETTWYSAETGLFSDSPHICLIESFWDDGASVASQRHYVIDGATGGVTRHAQTVPAYTDDQYVDMLSASGFTNVRFHASMGEDGEGNAAASREPAESGPKARGRSGDLVVVTAQKPGGTQA
jgi:SAM-dependent methyltransferase